MFSRQMILFAAIGLAVIGLATFLFPRKREGFQTQGRTEVNPIVVMQPPPNLMGNPDACAMFKSIIATTAAQLQTAIETNNEGQRQLLDSTKRSLEEQMALLQCP